MVSVLAFYSDNPSSNPAEVYNFSVKLLLKRTKINKKEAGVGPFFKKIVSPASWLCLKLIYHEAGCSVVHLSSPWLVFTIDAKAFSKVSRQKNLSSVLLKKVNNDNNSSSSRWRENCFLRNVDFVQAGNVFANRRQGSTFGESWLDDFCREHSLRCVVRGRIWLVWLVWIRPNL